MGKFGSHLGADQYAEKFASLNGRLAVRPYQQQVAQALFDRRHVLIRAPTGAGKTLGVATPFLVNRNEIGARRMIYTLPMRALAQSIFAELSEKAAQVGLRATIQTGEQPEDEFFDRGDCIVSTYDQLLSGALCGPYGLPDKLHNINAAAMAGNLVVFDEFHLMDPGRAFATAVECVQIFDKSVLSVWMTATATTPLCEYLKNRLNVQEISLSEKELFSLHEGLGIQRTIYRVWHKLSVGDLILHRDRKTLVVVNQVRRAQELYQQAKEEGLDPILLHSRFFKTDRNRQRILLQEHFGKGSQGASLAIATQVVEAGLDLSADILLTELCPMNALVQRAGRCARFEGQIGTVFVFDVESNLPYEESALRRTSEILRDGAELKPSVVSEWVEEAHVEVDRKVIAATGEKRLSRILKRVQIRSERQTRVSDLIREGNDTIRVLIRRDPSGQFPSDFESIQIGRGQLRSITLAPETGWCYDPDVEGFWQPANSASQLADSIIVCLSPAVACYTRCKGLELGQSGKVESYPNTLRRNVPEYEYSREPWQLHIDSVVRRSEERVLDEAAEGSLLDSWKTQNTLLECARRAAELHDVGKLQTGWDGWARRYQTAKDPDYQHLQPLAHTDYNPKSKSDRIALKTANAGGRRPPHAAASAIYGSKALRAANVPPEYCLWILYAVTAHHGGSWDAKDIQPIIGSQEKLTAGELERYKDFSFRFFGKFGYYWPMASYLLRTLRLADQKATEDFRTE